MKFINENGELKLDSRVMAEALRVTHPALFRLARERVSSVFKADLDERSDTTASGQKQKFYMLTEEEVLYLITLVRVTDESSVFKADLVRELVAARKLITELTHQLKETQALASDAIKAYDSFTQLILQAIETTEHVPNYVKRAAVEAQTRVLELKVREKELLERQSSLDLQHQDYIVKQHHTSLEALALRVVDKRIAEAQREFTRTHKRQPQERKLKQQLYYNDFGDVLEEDGKALTLDDIKTQYITAYDELGSVVYTPPKHTKVVMAVGDDEF